MKKLIAVTTALVASLTSAIPVFAVSITPCPPGQFGNVCNLTSASFPTVVQNIVTILFIVSVLVALFFLIWGGIKWIMSGGDKAKIESARNTIIGGIIGLILVFLAFFVIQVIAGLFGITINQLSLPTFGA